MYLPLTELEGLWAPAQRGGGVSLYDAMAHVLMGGLAQGCAHGVEHAG